MLIQVAHLLHTHHLLEVILTVPAEDLTTEVVAAAEVVVVVEEAAGDTKVSYFDATSEFRMLQLIYFSCFILSQPILFQHLIAMYIKLQLLPHMYHQNDHPIIMPWSLLPWHPYLTLM